MKLLISYIIFLLSIFKFINPNISGNSSFIKYHKNSSDTIQITLLSISYELSYDYNSVIKIILKISNYFPHNIRFKAFLRNDDELKEYILNCSKEFFDTIKCLSLKNITLDIGKKYYFYYRRNITENNIIFNGKDIFQDSRNISLIFKPKILDNITIYNNTKYFDVKTDKDMISSGYLYLTRKSKKVLQKPKNGFNKYIELNNFIPHCGLAGYMPQSTLIAYKEAIRRGYKIVDGDILFTKDKIPVICHGKNLENVSNGKGILTEKTINELEKLDFGAKFNKIYAGEKILKFEELLKLCKENNIIIDLDLWHLKSSQFFNTNEYAKIILKYVDKYDMINSIFFNDERRFVIELFQSIRNDISFSINGMNEKKNIEKIKDRYKSSKILIYNMGFLSSGRTINEKTVKYGLSLGKKIKAAKIDDVKFAEKVASWGVNFITTNKLHPFLIKNIKEEPIAVRCSSLDIKNGLSRCKIDEDIKLIDNEVYNIYYSNNIYNISEDIIEEPIGELNYINTNNDNKLYYRVENFDLKNGIIQLTTSNIIKLKEEIVGEISPAYDNVAECYKYNFICHGKNSHSINCIINKNSPEKVEFDGNYKINRLEGYSFNPYQLNKEIYKIELIILSIFMSTLIIEIIIKIKRKNKTNLKFMKIFDFS